MRPDHKVPWDQQALRVQTEPTARPARRGQWDPQVPPERMELMVLLALRDLLDRKARRDQ